MIPNIKQWNKWPLVNKYTVLGFFVGMASLIIALYQLSLYSNNDNNEFIKISTQELALLTENEIYTVKGSFVVAESGGIGSDEFDIRFIVPPTVKMKNTGFNELNRIKILDTGVDEFYFKISSNTPEGFTFTWEATGIIKSNK